MPEMINPIEISRSDCCKLADKAMPTVPCRRFRFLSTLHIRFRPAGSKREAEQDDAAHHAAER